MWNKGFTMLEILIVVSVFAVLLLLFPLMQPPASLSIDTHRIMMKLEAAQLDSILNQHHNTITLNNHSICFNSDCEELPARRLADEGIIEFNAAGNVNHAGTYCFREGSQCRCIVIQLGSGRMSIE